MFILFMNAIKDLVVNINIHYFYTTSKDVINVKLKVSTRAIRDWVYRRNAAKLFNT